MSKANKFGFGSLDPVSPTARSRSVGPMGAAVREAAESLTDATEAKIEQRRRNAEDAKTFRAAQADGLVLERLPIDLIGTADLPRDRLALEAVAASDEMEELKASIRARGQKEPIEVYPVGEGRFELKKGWRRLTALQQLFGESGDSQFATVLARVDHVVEDRVSYYVDMVEENVVREDLTFAEMAQVCIAAAGDAGVPGDVPEEFVARLYGALHKMKRSYIRGFVFLLGALGDDLKWPKAVSRNLGVEVSRKLRDGGDVAMLRDALRGAGSVDAQTLVLESFVQGSRASSNTVLEKPREKFEFHVGDMKVTARQGECRIVAQSDFAGLPRADLERAVRAFQDALRKPD